MKSGRRSAHAKVAPRRMEPRDPPAGRARFPQADEVGCTPQDRFGIGGILPGPTGIEFIQLLRRTRPEVAAILLSKHADSASAGIQEGHIPDGVAYLRKSHIHDTAALVAAIEGVTRGGAAELRHDRQSKGDLDLLTKSQREILHMMALGLSNKEIAHQRGVSLSSVEQRVSEIFKAFRIPADGTVVPRVEAVRRYIMQGGLPERAPSRT